MDVPEPSPCLTLVLAAKLPTADLDPVAEFERAMFTGYSFNQSEEELWQRIADDVQRHEKAMDAPAVARFEMKVDYVLSRHGLPSWMVIKRRLEQAAQLAPPAAA